MLQQLHERLRGFIAWLVVGLVSVTFVLFGIDYFLQSRVSSHQEVEVNGQSISERDVELAYRRMERTQPAHAAPPAALLKQQALTSLITTTLLEQAAKVAGLVVPPQQVRSLIMQIPAFQEKGHFSWTRYQQLLSNAWYTPLSFQKMMTQDLLINQQRFGVIGTAFALPYEADRALQQQFEQRDLRYVVLPLSAFIAKSQPSDDQMRAYYQTHAAEFMTPQAVRVAYVELSLDALKAALKPSDAVLKRYYEDNKASLPRTMPSFAAAKAMLTAQWIAEQAESQYAKDAETLSEMSYQYASSLTEVSQALRLPLQESVFFSRQRGAEGVSQSEAIRAAAFSQSVLSQGNNSEPIALSKTRLIVLRVLQQRPAKQLDYTQVRAQISSLLTREIAERALKEASEQLLTDKTPSTLKAFTWTTQTGLTRQSTALDPALREVAFQLSRAHQKQTVLFKNGDYACVQLLRMTPGDIKTLSAEQRQAVIQQLALKFGERDEALYEADLKKKAKIRP